MAFSPDGQTLAVGDDGGHVGLWDTSSGQRTATLAEGSPVDSVAFSPNGQTLAVGDYGGHVGLWDTGTGRRTATLAEGSTVLSVAFSPNGQTLAVGDGGGGVGLWDTSSGRRTATLAEGSVVRQRGVQPERPDARYWRPERQCSVASTKSFEFDWRLPLAPHLRRASKEYDASSMDGECSGTDVPKDLSRVSLAHFNAFL